MKFDAGKLLKWLMLYKDEIEDAVILR
jgi:hypothetical protein